MGLRWRHPALQNAMIARHRQERQGLWAIRSIDDDRRPETCLLVNKREAKALALWRVDNSKLPSCKTAGDREWFRGVVVPMVMAMGRRRSFDRVSSLWQRQHDGNGPQRRDVRHQFVTKAGNELSRLGYRLAVIHRNGQIGVQTVADPAGARADDFDAGHMLSGMLDGIGEARLHAIERAGDDRAGGLPDNAKDRNGDQQPHDWVRQGDPAHTPSAPATTARLVSPSVRA